MPYFQGFSNGDYKICESIARQTAEPSINFSGLLYRGIGGLVCRGISGLASGGIGGIVCAEYPVTWEYLGQGLIGDYMTFFRLENMIGTRNGYLGGREGIAFRNPENYQTILAWCRQYSEIAPQRIAHMMPLSVKENTETTWHPFSKAIIDEFGDNEKLVSQLSSNMGTFGTVGSSVPYFQIQKKLLQDLIDHPIQRIRDWATEMIEYTEKKIKLEKLGDEERSL